MATLVAKLSFVTRVAISGVWLTSHTSFFNGLLKIKEISMKSLMVRLLIAVGGGLLLIVGMLLVGKSSNAGAYGPPSSGSLVPDATFHLWVFNEVFSCAGGYIQFIEMVTTSPSQQFLAGHQLQATNLNGTQTRTFIFPNNAPGDSANKSLLIATSNFSSLAGGITPDYVIPPNFLFTEGGSVTLVGAGTFTYGAGQLPLDGVNSLGPGGVTAVNSPKNFAGLQGSVVCPQQFVFLPIIFKVQDIVDEHAEAPIIDSP
jgi:hypothetical protein